MTTTTDLVVPLTGQCVSLDDSTDVLADVHHQIAQFETELRMARATLRRELLERMDKELARKHKAGDFYLECDAPGQVEYDPEQLARVLVRLVTEDKIGREAAQLALKTEEVKKPLKRGIDKLLNAPALTEDDRAAIAGCAAPSRRERRLTVKKADRAAA